MSDKFLKRNDKVKDLAYSRKQVRDCIKGSNAIKRANEIYLPMPSGFHGISQSPSIQNNHRGSSEFSVQDLPWYHENPAYRAYLQRARFPDLTAAILKGIVGVINKDVPEIDLSDNIAYIEDNATKCNKSLMEMYHHGINEVYQSGKICIVVDFEGNDFKYALYSAERHINWQYGIVNGVRQLISSTFIEEYGDSDTEEKAIEYKIVNGIAVYQRYIDGKESGDETPLSYKGRSLNRLPVFIASADGKESDCESIPLLGVSDIALTIYRKDADLSQAHYMTCNPTLFIFGIADDQRPNLIGSTVTVSISNPDGRAEYPATDTSALDHVKSCMQDLYQEAISSGAQMLGIGSKGAESGEALAIREAASGASMVGVVHFTSKAINDSLKFINELIGSGESLFSGSIDFAENDLTPQQITALVSSWVQGAISHDTLLNRFREANIVDDAKTNQKEKSEIAKEQEDMMPVEDDKSEDNVENKDSE